MKRHATLLIAIVLFSGCYNESRLRGEGENEGEDLRPDAGDAVLDAVSEEINVEIPGDPDAVETIDSFETVDGPCCRPPLVLDPSRGFCIDPTGYRSECEGSPDICEFGQLCEPEFGIGLMGYFCHIPCGPDNDFVCPEGYACFSTGQCCDIPAIGCIVDTCTPPLLMHPVTERCVTFEGVGEDCSTEPACGEGQTCLSWCGIDGMERRTCEVECAGDPGAYRVCPNGYGCVDYDDGPQNICEPLGGLRGCDDPLAIVCGRPEKFNGENVWAVDRNMVCPRCYGVKFCVSPDGVSRVQSLAPEGAIRCGAGMCGAGLIECIFPFRSGINDCPERMPSDYFWTTVCTAANLDAVRNVTCYWLE
jgi:hypothetical protein